MKARIVSMLVLAALAAEAGTPLPAQVVYGRVRDAYGFPYADSGRISVSGAGVEKAGFSFGGILPSGLNYRLTLDMDSGGTPYSTHAVQTGEALAVAVEAGGVPQPLIPTNRLVAATPGSVVRLDLITGTDADGDGLPDEWEQLLVDQSGGKLTGIQGVKPGDDFDGDGLTNGEEFRACTFPFLATDLLQVSGFERLSANRVKLRFLSSLGITYSLVATETLESRSWVPLRFAAGEKDPVAFGEMVGNGSFQTVFIETAADAMFIRLTAHEP